MKSGSAAMQWTFTATAGDRIGIHIGEIVDNYASIIRELEEKFEFLMEKLGVFGTKDIVAKYVKATPGNLPEYAAASAELTAAAVVDPNEGE